MFMVEVNGMREKIFASFREAKKYALRRKGKVYQYVKAKLPKSAMIYYNDCAAKKREVYREIYSENNHGYHVIGRQSKKITY